MDTKQNCQNGPCPWDRSVKQQLFLNYYEARQEKLTKERIIRFWETAGLNPFDVDKVLNSSQMIAAKINKR